MDDATKNLLAIVLEAIQTTVVIVGAIWAYFRFFREGAHKPRIEFDIECSFMGPQQDRYVAAFTIHATNRGNIEHRFPEIRLRVRGITTNAPLNALKGREPLLEFPEREFEPVNIIPKKMEYYFVRPGVHQRFIYVTRVPTSWKYILAHAEFMYRSSRELHTAEKAFEVKPDITAKPWGRRGAVSDGSVSTTSDRFPS